MSVGFGLDLAGYSKPQSTVLVGIVSHGISAEAIILQESPFGKKISGPFQNRLKAESLALSDLLRLGKLAVDVPIDLDGLPNADATEAWQLTMRPIDQELKALAPLASWLGACSARFRAIMTHEHQEALGEKLFETYPKASLEKMLGQQSGALKKYKHTLSDDRSDAENARKCLCGDLKIRSPNLPLTHDEIDAVICAIAAVADREFLMEERQEFGLAEGQRLPNGFRILKENPFQNIEVSKISYDDGLKKFKK